MAVPISLLAEIEYIDITPEDMPYSVSMKLDNIAYELVFKYNVEHDFFTVDLIRVNQNEVLCLGEVIRYGKVLFQAFRDERFPNHMILPYDLTGESDRISFENFGKAVKLYYLDVSAA